MAVDTSQYVGDFDATKPTTGDPKVEGPANYQQVKLAAKKSFPNVKGPVTADHTELSYVDGVTAPIQTQLDAKAPIASPTFTGTPAVPTAAAATNTTQAASTAFVQTAIATVNAQVALTMAIDSGTSVAGVAGQHTVCTNPAIVTYALPPTPTANQRAKVTFSNALFSNIVDPGSEKVFAVSGTRTVNGAEATIEFVYVNSTIGWVH